MRGTRQISAQEGQEGRFIPACAGNTAFSTIARLSSSVHPRVCGEHAVICLFVHPVNGSSPRVRGTRQISAQEGQEGRFIPACAGNTSRPPACSVPAAVHPRVCGEHWPGSAVPPGSAGSSPRVRGTRRAGDVQSERLRFIPACAGNTSASAAWRSLVAVHPRVCGEHTILTCQALIEDGSSPRVRGTQWRVRANASVVRFIPACAGNTVPGNSLSMRSPVHPRVCGEHLTVMVELYPQCGSSPRVRGTRCGADASFRLRRFIPACAGNTSEYDCSKKSRSVHPRVCGEHSFHKSLIRNIFHDVKERTKDSLYIRQDGNDANQRDSLLMPPFGSCRMREA